MEGVIVDGVMEAAMYDILHLVAIQAPPGPVYAALTTKTGLAGWWTENISGDEGPGGVLKFRFDSHGGSDMKVLELTPDTRVVWECIDGAREWIGTRLTFELKPVGGETKLLFAQRGWREQAEFMHYCSTKWAVYLVGLKALIETGNGTPYPRDIPIEPRS
jgi:uncharacterized protein YndB with AHSA1/START domain